ncbi:MAG: protein translocase subunit SecD [Planctomycetaceae bacterium]|nr:protein translocase subunit SecD [Planctomycetaceae bacterium]
MSLLLNGLLILLLQAPGVAQEAADTAKKTDDVGTAFIEEMAKQDAKAADEVVQQASDATAAAASSSGVGEFLFAVIVLGMIILPFVFGNLLGKALKCPEWSGRIGIVIFTIILGLAPFISPLLKGESIASRFRLGIDLAGGTNMVFQVRGDGKSITPEIMDRMVGAVSKRINQSGTEEVTVRAVGADRIEVIVPGEDPSTVDEIKRKITRLGSLEFFIVADRTDGDIIRAANELDLSRKEVIIGNEVVARWVPAFERNGVPKFLTDANAVSRKIQKQREVNGKYENYETEEYLLLVGPSADQVTGKYLKSAFRDIDPQNGETIVVFNFDANGAYLFGQLTERNSPRNGVPQRHLAIVLDEKVFSAPGILSKITNRGQISGGFSTAEADELSSVLNAGALEVPIDPKPLSEATVDPTLGADVRNKGVNATLISGLAVVVFMLVYYRFSGVVAVISLVLNLLLTIAAMVAFNATFTLPGIAGIVLTIGMAVDANVLIYERMREEIAKGCSVRMAIQNGFEKAFITIFDANITTLLTAVVLFYFGTDQIRGFAVTLFLGLAISMYTALFVGRLLFDLFERLRILRTLKMMQFIDQTNFDFLRQRAIWYGISIAVIAIGLLAFFVRGEKNYDIDFTGGTMVSFQMTEAQKTDDVQKALAEQFGTDFTVERLTIGQETTEGVGTYFRVRTTESDDHQAKDEKATADVSAEDRVREKVFKAFEKSPSMKLRMVSLEFTDTKPVTIADDDKSAEAIMRMKYKGGSEAELTFSQEVASGTATDLLSAALDKARTKVEGTSTEELFGLEGTAGSGTTAAARSVRKYNKFTVRTVPDVKPEELKAALASIQDTLSKSPLFDEVNTFASAVAEEMKTNATIAIIFSILGISAYIWFRFQNVVFGLAAIVALVHDVLVALGSMAIAGYVLGTPIGNILLIDDFRINLSMIAAFLTLVGYSLNDTIVMFDRIRELRGKNPAVTESMVNLALNQTLGRTILTATTVFLVVFILYVFGGSGIHGFAWCLLIGCIAGTYSSIYIASPVLIWFLGDAKEAGRA